MAKYKEPMDKYRMDNDEVFGEEEPRKMKIGGSKQIGPAGNAVSPPEGPAYEAGQAKGDKSTGKGFGEKVPKAPAEGHSSRAYSGGQASGTKGFSSNKYSW